MIILSKPIPIPYDPKVRHDEDDEGPDFPDFYEPDEGFEDE